MEGPRARLQDALSTAAQEIGAPEGFSPELERPREPEHGDLATNAAMVLAGRLGRAPREVAESLASALGAVTDEIDEVEVAGPGFLNFRFSDAVYFHELATVLERDTAYGRARSPEPRRIDVEFVSANPTGPLHVAHGRGAALGDAIASLLEWTGHEVTREFYVNDAGRQIELLGESVEARFQQAGGAEGRVPEGGYHGDYVGGLADRLADERGRDELETLDRKARSRWFAERSASVLLREQEDDLAAFGVEMDVFRFESDLVAEGRIEAVLERLREAGLAYDDEGAVWLATTRFGDDKDRVLVKSDGSYTYFLPDIAYHLDKAERGFDVSIDVWGADHHGHVMRMKSALEGLGLQPDFLEVVILQLVSVMRGDEEVKMSKRAGEFVTLRELFEETGPDVARYFFFMRRAEVPLSFDLDLALDRSEANPVYKVKYAHARMCSIFRKGGVEGEELAPQPGELARLGTDAERLLAKALLRFPIVVADAAADRAPYRVCQYLERTAGLVNAWYHEGNLDPSLRVLADVPARPGRLALARAVQVTLRNGLELLGLEAPEQMIRGDDEGAPGSDTARSAGDPVPGRTTSAAGREGEP